MTSNRRHRLRHRSGQRQNVWRFTVSVFFSSTIAVEIRQCNNMGRVWDTFEYHLSFRWAYSWSKLFKAMGYGKVKLRIFCLGDVINVFRCFSSRMPKLTIEHFWNGPNRTKIENQENTEIPGKSVKMVIFDLYNAKARSFSKYLLYILYLHIIHPTGFFHIYSGFLKIR